jgi:hypothetical protein
MTKQPENANPTLAQNHAASARAGGMFHDSPEIREEIASLAYRYFQEHEGKWDSPEEDWLRAERVVFARRRASLTA